jgi:hypothetical protein
MQGLPTAKDAVWQVQWINAKGRQRQSSLFHLLEIFKVAAGVML